MTDLSELQLFQQVIMSFDTPAYMRRARDVEAAWNAVVMLCRKEREKLLAAPQRRLRNLLDTDVHLSVFDTRSAISLRAVLQQWNLPVGKGTSRASIPAKRGDADRLIATFEHFNNRWTTFLATVDLAEVNRLRTAYNEFYVLEKECAVRSPAVARAGFQPLQPATVQDLQHLFPLLDVPVRRQ
ncbi:MAG: hypothetical protein KDA81_00960 [Planctomycetaceae bacterium]|nr:hypothetical protein [Planctomycetaceae bacterium]